MGIEFKPHEPVFVRNFDSSEWKADFFSHYAPSSYYPFVCVSGEWEQCITAEGSEYLAGTCTSPAEKIAEKLTWTARHCGCPKVLYGTCMHPEDAETCFGEAHDPVRCTRDFFINGSAR